jgi:hypothetical protein
MSGFSTLTRAAHVRRGFSEECEWRAALGERAPLHVFVTSGPIDAPDYIPAGSTHGGTIGGKRYGWSTVTNRPDIYR